MTLSPVAPNPHELPLSRLCPAETNAPTAFAQLADEPPETIELRRVMVLAPVESQ